MAEDTDTDVPSIETYSRRSYLSGIGSGGLLLGTSALLFGTGSSDDTEEAVALEETGGFQADEPEAVQDSDVIDLGEEGLSEGDDVGAWLSDYIEDGLEIIVPAGRYDYSTSAFTRGLGDGYADVTVRGEGEFGDVVFDHGDGYNFSEVLSANGGDLLLDNIVWRGVAGGNGNITLQASEGDEVRLRRVARPDGSNDYGEGVFVRPEHAGVAVLEHCWFESFPDNGLYASAPGGSNGNDGEVTVIGGLYKNNNIANIRISGTNSTVESATVVLTTQHDDKWGSDQSVNMRGIWVREGTESTGRNITIRDCDVYNELPHAPIEINPRDGGGSGIITDTRVYNESDGVPAIGHLDGEWETDGVAITGNGDTTNEIDTGSCNGPECEQASPIAVEPIGDR
ncbi:hypothetical protein [Natranaeroarchaeum aerophilus]|uniref:Right-handed parallel beta-helix repeat-containing protein n=1 Tax=Natranaeroarchaeum aerophilus TaxID=2917711 RepID=A0AAE3FTW2_9EURY|nr:hypothetical protein [Natranaeroarchaeum aerophilus]MCL9814848.1 hypothetical protein [Natranaeroarchaeum aerophilus]